MTTFETPQKLSKKQMLKIEIEYFTNITYIFTFCHMALVL